MGISNSPTRITQPSSVARPISTPASRCRITLWRYRGGCSQYLPTTVSTPPRCPTKLFPMIRPGRGAAPPPPSWQRLGSDRVVIDRGVAKYSDHLPLYRQSVILQREAGVEIGRETLDGWGMRVGEVLIPMVNVIRRGLLGCKYLQADETPVDVQLHDWRGQHHQAYLWQYGQPGGGVVFDFCMGRGREGPKEFLGQFEGILQTDGYVAYEKVGGPKLVHAGCWAHSRRKFFDAVKLNPQAAVAPRIVKLIDQWFRIAALPRTAKLGHAASTVRRLEGAQPLAQPIRLHAAAVRNPPLPATPSREPPHSPPSHWHNLPPP